MILHCVWCTARPLHAARIIVPATRARANSSYPLRARLISSRFKSTTRRARRIGNRRFFASKPDFASKPENGPPAMSTSYHSEKAIKYVRKLSFKLHDCVPRAAARRLLPRGAVRPAGLGVFLRHLTVARAADLRPASTERRCS